MEKLNKLSLKRPCDSDLFTDEESEKAANCAKCDDKFNKLNEELIEIKSNLLDLKNILCEFVQNNNRTLNDSGKKEVIYNGKNLVDISASNTTKYVTQIMDLMFTKEELANGYIIEGNSRSKRDALDIGKIELLRDAFFTKYNIPGSNQDETYKWIKSRAKRKCQDTKMNN
ncbi:hypothetical protein BpHYR1_037104 [Brachionus plicatilis]|uniref:BEN domain-containing protein n=1 Tax=Brachionus plicatilis TaxID=10195 RepID=A0A3M7SSZ6_BRAPC|nr:hypothetical protein BpHYR1_037104 [Brachionus plicatilis]